VVLRELDRLVESRTDFAFESTLSGPQYARRIADWKRRGYQIEIVYLRLVSPKLALRRVKARVLQGGHGVPRADVLRRFKRGWVNFRKIYQPLADRWAIYENSQTSPVLLERGP
jgi:predicted ABC-type ATPase